MKYWMLHDDKVLGPFEPEALSRQPGYTDDTLVCQQGNPGTAPSDWKRAASVAEIAAKSRRGEPSQGNLAEFAGAVERLQDKVSLLDANVARLQETLRKELEEKSLHAQELADKLASLREGLGKALNAEHDMETTVQRQSRMIEELKDQLAAVHSEQQRAEERRAQIERHRAEIERQRADMERQLAEAAASAAEAAVEPSPVLPPAPALPAAAVLPPAPPVAARAPVSPPPPLANPYSPVAAVVPVEPAPVETAPALPVLPPAAPAPKVSGNGHAGNGSGGKPPKDKEAAKLPPAPALAPGASPTRTRHPALYLFAALLAPILVGLSSASFAVSMPAIAEGVGTDIPGIAWAMVAFPIVMAGLSVTFGRLGSRVGHRKFTLIGITIMNFGAFLCALSRNEVHMTIARAIEGIGGAIVMSNCRVVTTDALAAYGSSARAQAWVAVAVNFGAFLGYMTSGWIVDHLNWNDLFFALLGLGVLFTALDFKIMGSIQGVLKTARGDQSTDYSGAALILILISLLVVLLHGRMQYRVTITQRHELMALWLVLFIIFVVRETMAKNPMVNLSLFRVRNFSWSIICLHSSGLIRGMVMLFMPFYLYSIKKVDFSYLGACFAVLPIGMIICSNLSARLSDSMGVKKPMVLGYFFMILSMGTGVFLNINSPLSVAIAVLLLAGIGLGFLETPIFSTIMDSVGDEHRGLANGMIPTANQSGQTFGAAFSTYLLFMDFKWVLGNHVIPPMDGSVDSPIWAMLRDRIFVDPIVISFNVACLMGIMLCLLSFLGIYMMKTGKPKNERARA